MKAQRRWRAIVGATLAWLAGTLLVWVVEMPAVSTPLVLAAMFPGLGLFAYAGLQPTARMLAIRLISASVGLIAYFDASQRMNHCGLDGLCGLNIFNGAFADAATFGALLVAGALQDRAKTSGSRSPSVADRRHPEWRRPGKGRHSR